MLMMGSAVLPCIASRGKNWKYVQYDDDDDDDDDNLGVLLTMTF